MTNKELVKQVMDGLGTTAMEYKPWQLHVQAVCFRLLMVTDERKPWPERDDLLARIQSYLGNGGFFNPEAMEHDKVRDLIMDVRSFIGNSCQEIYYEPKP